MGCNTIFWPGLVCTLGIGRTGAEPLDTGMRRSRGPNRLSSPEVKVALGVDTEGEITENLNRTSLAEKWEICKKVLHLKKKKLYIDTKKGYKNVNTFVIKCVNNFLEPGGFSK